MRRAFWLTYLCVILFGVSGCLSFVADVAIKAGTKYLRYRDTTGIMFNQLFKDPTAFEEMFQNNDGLFVHERYSEKVYMIPMPGEIR